MLFQLTARPPKYLDLPSQLWPQSVFPEKLALFLDCQLMPDVFRRHVFGVSLVLVGREQGISNIWGSIWSSTKSLATFWDRFPCTFFLISFFKTQIRCWDTPLHPSGNSWIRTTTQVVIPRQPHWVQNCRKNLPLVTKRLTRNMPQLQAVGVKGPLVLLQDKRF